MTLFRRQRGQGDGRGDSPADQSVTEGLPASGQTALHRPDRAAKSVGRFLHRGALEQAQDKDVAVSGRQPPQLVVEDRHHVRPLGLPPLAGGTIGQCLVPVADSLRPGLPGHACCDSVEPGAEPIGGAEPGGFACQDEESRLEGVIGVVRADQDPSADAQDHRPVANDQRLERRVVSLGEESFKKGAIPRRDNSAPEQTIQVSKHRSIAAHTHSLPPPSRAATMILPPERDFGSIGREIFFFLPEAMRTLECLRELFGRGPPALRRFTLLPISRPDRKRRHEIA